MPNACTAAVASPSYCHGDGYVNSRLCFCVFYYVNVLWFFMLMAACLQSQLSFCSHPFWPSLHATGFGPGQGVTSASELELPYVEPLVTTASSDAAISLARKLKAAGAKMYGAFWCTHCYDQKQEFGVPAMADFPYVECFPQGWKRVCSCPWQHWAASFRHGSSCTGRLIC